MVQQDWTNFALQRPHYFSGQYLLDKDFALAHQYLHDRQRYLYSKLHLAGIVEGLEVEAIAGQPEVVVTSGTAIDGEGNLIVLSETIRLSIQSSGWLCLRYHEEARLLQQPEVPDSFTRFVEAPLLTLETLEIRDSQTVLLARVIPEGGEVRVDREGRCYSGVRLPAAAGEEISLQGQGHGLSLAGGLSLSGQLQLGDRSSLTAVSTAIDPKQDRPTVVPSEKAVKEHLEKRLVERLANLSAAGGTGFLPSITTQMSGELNSWQLEENVFENGTAILKLTTTQSAVELPRLSIERDSGYVGIGTLSPARTLDVVGTVCAKHVESTNPMEHWMYPADPIVYQDIFEALRVEAIAKYKNPTGYNDKQHTSANPWCDRPLICFADKTPDDSGALIMVPEGYDTVWVRVPGDCWYRFKARFFDLSKEDLGYWTAGKRHGNCYCPDGSLTDSHSNVHQWLPIPVGRAGKLLLTNRVSNLPTSAMWLSGLAFSRNPWAHATQSGFGYHWAVNGGTPIGWDRDAWNGDILAAIKPKTNCELMVPYVWTGRDKLLYLINHNNNWNGCMHSSITVNGQPIENFMATYDNPFARHWSSKTYNRYIAACIPAHLIPKPTAEVPPLLRVKIDMGKQDSDLAFREIGTHDLDVPAPV
ncbi:MAG: hypothetical protein VKK04_27275 [Synechococcales bacterium]|nr:hypothetical protein [Synechococcales bacterium]